MGAAFNIPPPLWVLYNSSFIIPTAFAPCTTFLTQSPNWPVHHLSEPPWNQIKSKKWRTQLRLLTTPRTFKKVTWTYLGQASTYARSGFTALEILNRGSYSIAKSYLKLYYKFSTLRRLPFLWSSSQWPGLVSNIARTAVIFAIRDTLFIASKLAADESNTPSAVHP